MSNFLEMQHIDISGVPNSKNSLAAYYGFTSWKGFKYAMFNYCTSELKKYNYSENQRIFSPLQLKCIVSILGKY